MKKPIEEFSKNTSLVSIPPLTQFKEKSPLDRTRGAVKTVVLVSTAVQPLEELGFN